MLIGDSITQGASSEPQGPSYASLLAASLGDAYQLVNLGCNGTSSLDWTQDRGHFACHERDLPHVNLYEDRVPAALPADLVAILLGTNDARGGYEPEPIPAEVYRDAISELIAKLRAGGARQVLLLVPPPQYHDMPTQKRIFAYRAEVEALCGVPDDAILCGPDTFLLLQPEDFAEGDPHPNARGHQKLADALRAAIVAAIGCRAAPASAGGATPSC